MGACTSKPNEKSPQIDLAGSDEAMGEGHAFDSNYVVILLLGNL